MKKNLSLKLMLLWMASIMFALNLSAQTVSLSPEQCEHTIQYGEPILCTANDSAAEYEFKFFTRHDTVVINTTRNYLLVDEYRNKIRTHVNFNVVIRCKFGNDWGQYGDTCSSLIYLDGFEELLAKYGLPEEPINNLRSGESGEELYEIPIVFHVFVPMSHNGDLADYLPPEKIYESVQILNDVFSGATSQQEDGPSVDTKIRFCIAKEDRDGNEIKVTHDNQIYYGITYLKTDETENINAFGLSIPGIHPNGRPIYDPSFNYYNRFPRNKYLNIFVFEHLEGNAAGKAWSEYFGQNCIGYVSLAKQFIGTNNSSDRSLGYSLPHEVGHFLGLYHTWHYPTESYAEAISLEACQSCESCSDDGVEDTPCHLSASTYCDSTTNEPIHNIMNYTPDGCRRVFTEDQKNTYAWGNFCRTII